MVTASPAEMSAALRRWCRLHPVLATALLCAAGLALVNVLFNQKIGTDTAFYYARLADAFGRGDYAGGFFHTVPPLVPLLAGLVARLGVSGWTGMKVVSGLFFVGSVWWSYRLARLRLPARQAEWAALLYVGCSRLLRYGMAGQLDAAKMFFLVFVTERVWTYARERRLGCLVQAAVGAAMMGLCRNEGIAYIPAWGLLLLTAPWLYPRAGGDHAARLGRAFRDGVIFAVIVVALWVPALVWQYRATRLPLLTARQVGVAARFMPFLDVEQSPYFRAFRDWRQERYQPPPMPDDGPPVGSVPYKAIETWKGLYPQYVWLALLGVVVLLRRRRWRREDSVLAALLLYHLLMLWALLPNIQKRLVAPSVVLYFPWVIVAGRHLLVQARARGWRPLRGRPGQVLQVIGVLVLAGLFWDGMSALRDSFDEDEARARRLGRWIADHADELDVATGSPERGMLAFEFFTGQQPVIATNVPQVGTWAEADMVLPSRRLYGRDAELPAVLARHHVDVLVTTPSLLAQWPDFKPEEPAFRQAHEDGPLAVYTVHLD